MTPPPHTTHWRTARGSALGARLHALYCDGCGTPLHYTRRHPPTHFTGPLHAQAHDPLPTHNSLVQGTRKRMGGAPSRPMLRWVRHPPVFLLLVTPGYPDEPMTPPPHTTHWCKARASAWGARPHALYCDGCGTPLYCYSSLPRVNPISP